MSTTYTGEDIRTLKWNEHIRLRPGMYIGKLGDGSAPDDGIYVLIKEVLDNSLDEYMMGFGKQILIQIEGSTVTVRDFGRGIPLEKVEDASSKMNTGAKYDSKAFKKSVGLNGVGIKAVNALSSTFTVQAFRDGRTKRVSYCQGDVIESPEIDVTTEPDGTLVSFTPDESVFGPYTFSEEYIENLLKNYAFLNTGLVLQFNGKKIVSKNGLRDLLEENMSSPGLYPIIHLQGTDIEVAVTHGIQYNEEYFSFVNGQHTTQGGTHLQAFKEAFVRTIRDFYHKDYEASDVRTSIIAAVSIKVEEPVFESQTKTRLGSKDIGPEGPSISKFIGDFLKKELDNYLHRNTETADILLRKIAESEKDRKAMADIRKLAKEKSKKVSLSNSKLRDCRIHFTDNKPDASASSIFITEGLSASGSITKSRDVNTQAVFSLRGKPLNSFGMTKKVVYENEEFNLLQAALDIEDGLENLRYNKVIIATDADDDGMHIRLLLITFFLQFFPDLVRQGHLYILQTPLFRVRNKKQTRYCYSDEERVDAIHSLRPNPEITRFKGLGEISESEFKHFIGEHMRLETVRVRKNEDFGHMLEFYMGKNTPERQAFIVENLRIEEDRVDQIEAEGATISD